MGWIMSNLRDKSTFFFSSSLSLVWGFMPSLHHVQHREKTTICRIHNERGAIVVLTLQIWEMAPEKWSEGESDTLFLTRHAKALNGCKTSHPPLSSSPSFSLLFFFFFFSCCPLNLSLWWVVCNHPRGRWAFTRASVLPGTVRPLMWFLP